MEEVLNEPEAAKLLRISQRKLFDLRKAGEVPCRRFGRRVVYLREELLRVVGERKAVEYGEHLE